MTSEEKTCKVVNRRNGFSLIELVMVTTVVTVLSLMVFAGGRIVVKKSEVNRVTHDLHNFSIAVESTLYENPQVANYATCGDGFLEVTDGVVAKLNANMQIDYVLEPVDTSGVSSGISYTAGTSTSTYQVYRSAKRDAWDNNYYVIFDCADRHGTDQSDFYITVISAGPDALLTIGSNDGNLGKDDIFLLAQYTDGQVTSMMYDVDRDDIYIIPEPSNESKQETLDTMNTVSKRTNCTWGSVGTSPVNY